jgi:cell division transport system ATP-binding protein
MIVTRKLSKTYPAGVRALVDVSVVFPQGEFAFLVGPNGAGKTTLFKLLTYEEGPTSGCVLFEGRDVHSMNSSDLARHRRKLGAVFQDARLVAAKTAAENIALPLETEGLSEHEVAERVGSALVLANLAELRDRFPDELSGGQQQQVAIARALVNRPKAILADEPTGNLSPAATDEIMQLLVAVNRRGITVVVATHNHEVVDAMARRVVALDRGQLVADTAYSMYPEFLRKSAA